eukprot:gene5060-3647_t
MDEDAIFNAICDSDSTLNLSVQVDRLIEEYQKGNTRAPLHAVVSTIAKACGATSVEIQTSDVDASADVVAVLENLYQCVPVDSSAYLLVNRDPKYKKFQRRFDDLWKLLIRSAFTADILFQDPIIPSHAHWLVTMSESKCRSFRHTSTVAVLSVIQALNELGESLKTRLTFIHAAEEMTAVQKDLDQVIQWRDHFFSQTVHSRVRDVAPEIRMSTIQHLKKWALEFPEEFMENKYLRYFGMPLHDKKPALRAEALDMILQGLGRVEGAYSHMKLFIQYFIKRIVEMSSDVDTKCVELSLRVMAIIVKRSAESSDGEVLSSEMIDAALRALFDERHTVRTAAGVLLTVFVYTRSADAEEAEQYKVAAELVGAFAGTLRTQYMEVMPERYLVDALWNAGMPPALFTDTRALTTDLTRSGDVSEVIVGTGFIASILQRFRGALPLGPAAKDDRRTGLPKVPPSKLGEFTAFKENFSSEAVMALSKVLKKHYNQSDILYSIAMTLKALDLSMVTSASDQANLTDVLAEFRRGSLSVTFSATLLEAVVAAWDYLIHSDHPLRTEAEDHVQQMIKCVQKEVTGLGRGSQRKKKSDVSSVTARCFLLSSLAPLVQEIPSLEIVLENYLDVSTTDQPEVTAHAIGIMLNEVLWCAKASTDANIEMSPLAHDNAQKLVKICFTTCAAASSSSDKEEDSQHARLATVAFTSICDVATLQLYSFSDTDQENLLAMFKYTFELCGTFFRKHQEMYRAAQNAKAETVEEQHSRLYQSKAKMHHFEALQLRVVESIGRLFTVAILPPLFAPKLLYFWTQTPAKSVSGFFKRFFISIRDKSGDSFSLERDTIAEAYNKCIELGATPLSIETLSQLGAKLASMHFTLAADRYYSSCVSMVEHGIEFASSVDPLILQAIVPYCTKLKLPEALHLLRHELPGREIFKRASHPYVRAFISALCRSAKVEDVTANPQGKKRQREINETMETNNTENALEELVDSVRTSIETDHTVKGRGSNGRGSGQRQTTDEGWRILPEDVIAPQHSAESQKDKKKRAPKRLPVNLPSTQETITSLEPPLSDPEIWYPLNEHKYFTDQKKISESPSAQTTKGS